MTTIEWTQQTWNPVSGCSKVSPGCAHCYAETLAKRFWGDRPFTEVRFHPERLQAPIKRRKPTVFFVNSMSDLFHPAVTDEQLDQIFAVMALTPRHTYQCLTKRPERMLVYLKDRDRHGKVLLASKGNQYIPGGMYPLAPYWPLPNLWLGVTTENQKTADERIPLLLQTPAAVRFLSVEPQLEAISLANAFVNVRYQRTESGKTRIVSEYEGHVVDESTLTNYGSTSPKHRKGIDWVICGGESGAGARPFDLAWARSLRDQCKDAGVSFFMKQCGSNPVGEGADGMTGKGNDFEQLPPDLQVREMPVGVLQ